MVCATLPIILTVYILCLLVDGISMAQVLEFSAGAVCVIIGMAIFLLGIKIGLLPLGEVIGSSLPGLGSLKYVLAVVFSIGFAITIAEPNITVLSTQIGMVTQDTQGFPLSTMLLAATGMGIGIFMSIAVIRIIFRIPVTYMLLPCYLVILILSLFVPEEFVSVAFDAGGVTTGPLVVPVVLSLGIGLSSVLARESSTSDGFGLIGLASVGPILGVMLMGIILG